MPDRDDATEDLWKEDAKNRIASDAMLQGRLRSILEQFREIRQEAKELRIEIDKIAAAGVERSYLIRRLDERMADLFVRLALIENSFVKKEDYQKAIDPIKKSFTWVITFVIGAVLAAVLGTVLQKSGVPH